MEQKQKTKESNQKSVKIRSFMIAPTNLQLLNMDFGWLLVFFKSKKLYPDAEKSN